MSYESPPQLMGTEARFRTVFPCPGSCYDAVAFGARGSPPLKSAPIRQSEPETRDSLQEPVSGRIFERPRFPSLLGRTPWQTSRREPPSQAPTHWTSTTKCDSESGCISSTPRWNGHGLNLGLNLATWVARARTKDATPRPRAPSLWSKLAADGAHHARDTCTIVTKDAIITMLQGMPMTSARGGLGR